MTSRKEARWVERGDSGKGERGRGGGGGGGMQTLQWHIHTHYI